MDIVLECYATCDVKRKHAKVYYSVESTSDLVRLCCYCGRYLMENKKRNLPGEYWPAMIYVFLSHENSSDAMLTPFKMRWDLLPPKWKNWWYDEFSAHMCASSESSVFTDVTAEAARLEEAINNLEWMELAVCMDRHFAYPEVSGIDTVIDHTAVRVL